MISVAVDITALARNPHGGIARVCRATVEEISRSQDFRVTACYLHGQRPYLTSNISPRRIGFLRHISLRSYDIAHSLCHRRLPVRAGCHIYSVHDTWSLYPNPYQSADFQRKLATRLRRDIERADFIVTGSEWTKSELVRLGAVDTQRCKVIPDGVVVPQKEPSPSVIVAKSGLQKGCYVIFVGRLEYRKNLPHVIEALQGIPNLRLVCVGEPGYGYETTVVPAFAALPDRRLTVLSNVSDDELQALYTGALAALQPSWEEGFGLPVLEAMAAGCPVVTADCSATREIGQGAAVLVDPSSPSQSRDALERLRQDQSWRDQLIASGRVRATEYTWTRYGSALAELYRQLTSA